LRPRSSSSCRMRTGGLPLVARAPCIHQHSYRLIGPPALLLLIPLGAVGLASSNFQWLACVGCSLVDRHLGPGGRGRRGGAWQRGLLQDVRRGARRLAEVLAAASLLPTTCSTKCHRRGKLTHSKKR
jgi:hypothetical protein